MKNKTPLLLLASLTVAAAMILANLNVELTASVVSSIGLAALLFSEYGRGAKPLAAEPGPVVPAQFAFKKAA